MAESTDISLRKHIPKEYRSAPPVSATLTKIFNFTYAIPKLLDLGTRSGVFSEAYHDALRAGASQKDAASWAKYRTDYLYVDHSVEGLSPFSSTGFGPIINQLKRQVEAIGEDAALTLGGASEILKKSSRERWKNERYKLFVPMTSGEVGLERSILQDPTVPTRVKNLQTSGAISFSKTFSSDWDGEELQAFNNLITAVPNYGWNMPISYPAWKAHMRRLFGMGLSYPSMMVLAGALGLSPSQVFSLLPFLISPSIPLLSILKDVVDLTVLELQYNLGFDVSPYANSQRLKLKNTVPTYLLGVFPHPPGFGPQQIRQFRASNWVDEMGEDLSWFPNPINPVDQSNVWGDLLMDYYYSSDYLQNK
jgi:hypothetical protein